MPRLSIWLPLGALAFTCIGLKALGAEERLQHPMVDLRVVGDGSTPNPASRAFRKAWLDICRLLATNLIAGKGPWGLGAFSKAECEPGEQGGLSSWIIEVSAEKEELRFIVKSPQAPRTNTQTTALLRPPLQIRIPLTLLLVEALQELESSQALAIALLDALPMFTRATRDNVEWLRGPKIRTRSLDALLPEQFRFFELWWDDSLGVWSARPVSAGALDGALSKRDLWAVGTQPPGALTPKALAFLQGRAKIKERRFLAALSRIEREDAWRLPEDRGGWLAEVGGKYTTGRGSEAIVGLSLLRRKDQLSTHFQLRCAPHSANFCGVGLGLGASRLEDPLVSSLKILFGYGDVWERAFHAGSELDLTWTREVWSAGARASFFGSSLGGSARAAIQGGRRFSISGGGNLFELSAAIDHALFSNQKSATGAEMRLKVFFP